MEQIYKSLKSLVPKNMIAVIAERFNADEAVIEQTVSSIFAGFLALTRHNGDTIQLRNIFDEAGSLNLLSQIESVCSEPLTPEAISIGDNFLQQVLGDRASIFTGWITLETGLPSVTVNTLVAILAPVFVGYVGNKLIGNQWSMHKLLGVIDNQMNTYKKFAPDPVS